MLDKNRKSRCRTPIISFKIIIRYTIYKQTKVITHNNQTGGLVISDLGRISFQSEVPIYQNADFPVN